MVIIMFDLNHLLMAVISVFLLLTVNHYLPLNPLVNLIYNCFMIVLMVVYTMQFFGVVKGVLPSPKLFK